MDVINNDTFVKFISERSFVITLNATAICTTATTSGRKNTIDPVSALITKGLGGKANISDVDCCATRLRITVEDAGKVNEDILKQSGSRGIVKKGQGVQINLRLR